MVARGRLPAPRLGATACNRWKTTWVAAVVGLFVSLARFTGSAVPPPIEPAVRGGVFAVDCAWILPISHLL
jgi:hypothetical protein